jgi:hypothetical protein
VYPVLYVPLRILVAIGSAPYQQLRDSDSASLGCSDSPTALVEPLLLIEPPPSSRIANPNGLVIRPALLTV